MSTGFIRIPGLSFKACFGGLCPVRHPSPRPIIRHGFTVGAGCRPMRFPAAWRRRVSGSLLRRAISRIKVREGISDDPDKFLGSIRLQQGTRPRRQLKNLVHPPTRLHQPAVTMTGSPPALLQFFDQRQFRRLTPFHVQDDASLRTGLDRAKKAVVRNEVVNEKSRAFEGNGKMRPVDGVSLDEENRSLHCHHSRTAASIRRRPKK